MASQWQHSVTSWHITMLQHNMWVHMSQIPEQIRKAFWMTPPTLMGCLGRQGDPPCGAVLQRGLSTPRLPGVIAETLVPDRTSFSHCCCCVSVRSASASPSYPSTSPSNSCPPATLPLENNVERAPGETPRAPPQAMTARGKCVPLCGNCCTQRHFSEPTTCQ